MIYKYGNISIEYWRSAFYYFIESYLFKNKMGKGQGNGEGWGEGEGEGSGKGGEWKTGLFSSCSFTPTCT